MHFKTMIITVVTPSYNHGRFLEDTIKSVLFQEGDFFIDYIIMDGGSDDQSIDIIQKYERLLNENCSQENRDGFTYYAPPEEKQPWHNCLGISLRWESTPDNGQVHALKKGFRIAAGEIFCWLNSDDFYLDQTVLARVQGYFSRDSRLALLFGDGELVSETGDITRHHYVKKINTRELLFLDYHILQPASFFHRSIYVEDHLDESFTCAFDADFFIRHIVSGHKYRKVADRFAAFRFYDENKTNKLRDTRFRESMKIAKKYTPALETARQPFKKYFFHVSRWYRRIQMRAPGRWFIPFRRIAYRLVTGHWKRRG